MVRVSSWACAILIHMDKASRAENIRYKAMASVLCHAGYNAQLIYKSGFSHALACSPQLASHSL